MEYYYCKIPISDSGLDYPAGCILCCAFPYDGYMYCKFENVTSIGTGWIRIYESEFNSLCPDFPTPEYSAGEAESEEYSGCFYRMVDGEQEWINPPMVIGQAYRTTERFNGKPVYAAVVEYKKTVSESAGTTLAGIMVAGSTVIHVSGVDVSSTLGTSPINSNTHAYYVNPDTLNLTVRQLGTDIKANGWVLIKFIKPEADE